MRCEEELKARKQFLPFVLAYTEPRAHVWAPNPAGYHFFPHFSEGAHSVTHSGDRLRICVKQQYWNE